MNVTLNPLVSSEKSFLLQFGVSVPENVALKPSANKGVNHNAPCKLSPVYERHLEKICIIY